MYPALVLIVISACALAVVFATRLLGRLAGLSTAALFGVSVAFFAMEPMFSFAVDGTFDRITLIVYGIASLFVVHRAPPRRPLAFPPTVEPHQARPECSPVTALAEIIQTAAARSGRDGIPVDVDPGTRFRGLPGDVRSLLTGILELALLEVAPNRIVTYGAELSGRSRIWIALQYRPAPDVPYSLVTGKRMESCIALDTRDHPDCTVTSFDNGFERVLQISLRGTAGMRG